MKQTFGAQATELASAENAGLRASMDNEVKAALGLDNINNGGGTPPPAPAPTNGGGGAPAPSGDSNPIVHTEHTSQGDINIRRDPDNPGEYRTDSGIILQGSTVDNMRRNSGGDGGSGTPPSDPSVGGGNSSPAPTPSGNGGSDSSQPHPVPAGGDGGDSSHDSGSGSRGGGSHSPAGNYHGNPNERSATRSGGFGPVIIGDGVGRSHGSGSGSRGIILPNHPDYHQ